MAPDINPQDVQQNPKYPSIPQVIQWMTAHANATDPKHWVLPPVLTEPTEKEIVEFFGAVAKKACDWQSRECREQVARWMLSRGFATGHGDTIEDLLTELVGEVRSRDALGRSGGSNAD